MRNFDEIFRKNVPRDNIQSHRKTGFHLLFGRYIFGKITVGVKLTPPSPPSPSPILGLSSKYSQKLLDHTKKSARDALQKEQFKKQQKQLVI